MINCPIDWFSSFVICFLRAVSIQLANQQTQIVRLDGACLLSIALRNCSLACGWPDRFDERRLLWKAKESERFNSNSSSNPLQIWWSRSSGCHRAGR